MKVTLEQIDELRNRVNVSYEEAKKTLEKNDGDLIKSIIELEKKKGRRNEKHHGGFTAAVNKLLALRMSVKTRTEIQFKCARGSNISCIFDGIWAVIFGLVLAILTSCKITVYRDKAINVKQYKEKYRKRKNKRQVRRNL